MKGKGYLWRVPLLSLAGSVLVSTVCFFLQPVRRALAVGNANSFYYMPVVSAVVLVIALLYILLCSYFFCGTITRKQCLFSCLVMMGYMVLQSILFPVASDLLFTLTHWPSREFSYFLENLLEIPVRLYGTIPDLFAEIEKVRLLTAPLPAQDVVAHYVYGAENIGYSTPGPAEALLALTPFFSIFLFLIFAGRKLPRKTKENLLNER